MQIPEAPASLSVVIPCWNAEKWIGRAIQSVIDQNYPNLEIIVIDDGSTDGSPEIIKSFGVHIRWKTGPKRGACVVRNHGLALASSEYVLFLDADDYVEGDLLFGFSKATEIHEADIIFAPAYKEFDGHRRERWTIPQIVDPRLVALSWIRGEYVPPGSVFWRRGFVTALGGWNLTTARNQDGELMLRALTQSPSIAHSHEGCSIYVQHDSPGRVSRRKSREALMSAIDVLCQARQTITAIGWMDEAFARVFYANLYGNALQCFEQGELLTGRRALTEMQSLGVRGHYGSWISRLAAAVLGLEYTGRLKSYWHQIRSP